MRREGCHESSLELLRKGDSGTLATWKSFRASTPRDRTLKEVRENLREALCLITEANKELAANCSARLLGESHLPTGDLTALPVGEGRSPVGG